MSLSNEQLGDVFGCLFILYLHTFTKNKQSEECLIDVREVARQTLLDVDIFRVIENGVSVKHRFTEEDLDDKVSEEVLTCSCPYVGGASREPDPDSDCEIHGSKK